MFLVLFTLVVCAFFAFGCFCFDACQGPRIWLPAICGWMYALYTCVCVCLCASLKTCACQILIKPPLFTPEKQSEIRLRPDKKHTYTSCTDENSLLFAVGIKCTQMLHTKKPLAFHCKIFFWTWVVLMTDIQDPSAMHFNVLKLLQEKLVYFFTLPIVTCTNVHIHCCMLPLSTICFLRS